MMSSDSHVTTFFPRCSCSVLHDSPSSWSLGACPKAKPELVVLTTDGRNTNYSASDLMVLMELGSSHLHNPASLVSSLGRRDWEAGVEAPLEFLGAREVQDLHLGRLQC